MILIFVVAVSMFVVACAVGIDVGTAAYKELKIQRLVKSMNERIAQAKELDETLALDLKTIQKHVAKHRLAA